MSMVLQLHLIEKAVFPFAVNLKITLFSHLNQMTVKEQQEWKIPPCISNWKNAKVIKLSTSKV